MSSVGQATSSSTSNSQLTIDALADYAKIAGVDLSGNPFAVAVERSNSPEAVLELLREREKAFKEYRDGNRMLINCLSPVVKVIHALSQIVGEAGTLVSHKYDLVLFKQTSSGPLPTSDCFVCCDRCSPCCTSFEYALQPVYL
jgi:hypothetical protein